MSRAPSSKQLYYLRSLALQTGTSFTPPATSRDASREIKRLRERRSCEPCLRCAPSAPELELTYGTAPAEGEIAGYGSTATWATPQPSPTDRQLAYLASLAEKLGVAVPEPTTRKEASCEIERLLRQEEPTVASAEEATVPSSARRSPSGKRVELARYSISDGLRVLYGQRVDGDVQITDRPLGADGKSYLVESGIQHDGLAALEALVLDYAEQGCRLDRVPAARSVF
jgi:hypothetical protein